MDKILKGECCKHSLLLRPRVNTQAIQCFHQSVAIPQPNKQTRFVSLTLPEIIIAWAAV